MTQKEWKTFNLKLALAALAFMVSFIICRIVLYEIAAKYDGYTCRVVCEVSKGEKQ
jgi:hypothetical protein